MIKKKICMLFAVVLLLVTLSQGAAFASHDTMGSYQGNAEECYIGNLHQNFESWVGRSESYVIDCIDPYSDSWDNIVWCNWLLDYWQQTGLLNKLILSVPMLPYDGSSTLSAGAAGSYDGYFRSLGDNLKSYGLGSMIIRLGWEFNGTWNSYYAGDGAETAFVNCWRKEVTAMKKASSSFKFLWCPALGVADGNVNLDTAYPGNSYVNYIGADIYDDCWADNTYPIPANATAAQKLTRWTNAWNYYTTQTYGLNWLSSLSTSTGKKIIIGEWGVDIRPDGHGGGDNPYFIQWMHDWMAGIDSKIFAQLYFNYNADDGNHLLTSPELVNAGNKFKALW